MDISKCANKECPLRDKCWRFTAPDSPYRQAYADFEFKVNEKGEVKCDYFWKISPQLEVKESKEIELEDLRQMKLIYGKEYR